MDVALAHAGNSDARAPVEIQNATTEEGPCHTSAASPPTSRRQESRRNTDTGSAIRPSAPEPCGCFSHDTVTLVGFAGNGSCDLDTLHTDLARFCFLLGDDGTPPLRD
jgi:hypothetical protein